MWQCECSGQYCLSSHLKYRQEINILDHLNKNLSLNNRNNKNFSQF